MSVLVYSRHTLRPGADRVALGNTALDVCRFTKARDGCLNARYYWADTNTVVMLSEFASARDVFAETLSADGVKLTFALADLADRADWQIWSGAREGTEANRMAGR